MSEENKEYKNDIAEKHINALNVFSEKYELLKIDSDDFDRKVNASDYTFIEKQIETMQTINFGSEINVLIITDRLFGYAIGLQQYLQNSVDITVDLVSKLRDAEQIADQKTIDFLIIVGYLAKYENYRSMQAVKKTNKNACVIMYASLDSAISAECVKHGIIYKYHRKNPLDGFIEYMRQCNE